MLLDSNIDPEDEFHFDLYSAFVNKLLSVAIRNINAEWDSVA